MNDGREGRALGRVIRLDLIIAICALLISSFATLASVWQAQLVQRQLSAAVLPYLSIEGSFSANEVKFSIENFGPGPAIIKDAVLVLDGVPQKNLPSYLRPMLDKLKPGIPLTISTNDITTGDAVRPGDSLVFVDLKAQGVRNVMIPTVTKSNLIVCYCSILDQCWSNSHGQNKPTPVGSCDDKDPHMIAPAGFDANYRDSPKRK